MDKAILVTGASGNVGSEVVKALAERGRRVRAAGSDPEALKARFGTRVETVEFDFSSPATWGPAFKDVEGLFLMRPPQLSNVKRDLLPSLEAARAAGLARVSFLSLLGVEDNPRVPHYAIEAYLKASNLDYTFLRASFFMQNLSGTNREEIRSRDELYLPVKDARTSFVDARDLGEAAAITLTGEGHARAAYDLTGPEALDYQQVAELLGSALGRKISYRSPSPFAYVLRQLSRRQPLMFALVSAWLYSNTGKGMADHVSPDLEALLGRRPRAMAEFIGDHRALWMP